MSYNGSGTFNINTTGQPVVTGTVISTTAFNALTADLGTGLSTAITKDGQTVATARIPFAAGINSSLVTDATSTTTGSIITAGGVGIAKALFVGTTANIAGTTTLAGVTATSITDSGLTSGRVTYAGTAGLLQDSANLTFSGSALAVTGTLTSTLDATVYGVTVGRGAGAVATNTAVGASALAANTTGASNVALGNYALTANTTASNNTAVGYQAAYANTTGSYLTAIGYHALKSSTADENTAVGYAALTATTTGAANTAVGDFSLAVNITGAENSAFGSNALGQNTTGGSNTAVGRLALAYNTTASNNTAVGYQAGYSQTTADGNVLIGISAGYGLTTGNLNTFVGASCGVSMSTGTKNTLIGRYTGNQGGLDIRTASNYIVLSDGDGNPRVFFDNNGSMAVGVYNGNALSATTNGLRYYPGTGANTESSAMLTNERTDTGGETFIINRQVNDGILIQFRQANTSEGTISVSGTTVSYNGGHLSRYAQTTTAKDNSLVKGTVLSNLDEMSVYTDAQGNPVANEQLNKVKVSDIEGDVNVAGVFVNWSHDEEHNVDEINMAMTGDMIIRITQGVTVQRGDLLMSAGDGTAKPQGDDIIRSKTVAKVTSNHVTCTYADGSYCVPCVLMAC